MLNSKKLTVLAGLVIGVSSMTAQAAVVQGSNYSYFDIGGTAQDGVKAAGGSFSGVRNTYALSAADVGISSNINERNSVNIGSADAYADSAATVVLSGVTTLGNATHITGSVSSSANAGAMTATQNAYSFADAVIDLDFSIDSTYSFTFSSELMQASDNADVYFDLYRYDDMNTLLNRSVHAPDPSLGSLIFSGNIVNGFDNPWITGSLASGNYSLVVEAISDADGLSSVNNLGAASANFDLALTAVPVPAAVWLFGSGLLGLAGFARRKAK